MEANYQVWLCALAAELAVEPENLAHIDGDLRRLHAEGVCPFEAGQSLQK